MTIPKVLEDLSDEQREELSDIMVSGARDLMDFIKILDRDPDWRNLSTGTMRMITNDILCEVFEVIKKETK